MSQEEREQRINELREQLEEARRAMAEDYNNEEKQNRYNEIRNELEKYTNLETRQDEIDEMTEEERKAKIAELSNQVREAYEAIKKDNSEENRKRYYEKRAELNKYMSEQSITIEEENKTDEMIDEERKAKIEQLDKEIEQLEKEIKELEEQIKKAEENNISEKEVSELIQKLKTLKETNKGYMQDWGWQQTQKDETDLRNLSEYLKLEKEIIEESKRLKVSNLAFLIDKDLRMNETVKRYMEEARKIYSKDVDNQAAKKNYEDLKELYNKVNKYEKQRQEAEKLRKNLAEKYKNHIKGGLNYEECLALLNRSVKIREDYEDAWVRENVPEYKDLLNKRAKIKEKLVGQLTVKKEQLDAAIEMTEEYLRGRDESDPKYNEYKKELERLKKERDAIQKAIDNDDLEAMLNLYNQDKQKIDDLKKKLEEKKKELEKKKKERDKLKEKKKGPGPNDPPHNPPHEEEKNNKIWLKALVGAVGFAAGLGLSCVKGVGTIRMAAAGVKITASAVRAWTNRHPDGRIARITNTIHNGIENTFPGITERVDEAVERLHSSPLNWFVNGVSAGYITGNVIELVTGKTLLEHFQHKKVPTTPTTTPSNQQHHPNKNPKADTPAPSVEKVVDTPAPSVEKVADKAFDIAKGDTFDLSGLEYGSRQAGGKLVHLSNKRGKEAKIGRTVIKNGIKYVSTRQKNGAGYAWVENSKLIDHLIETGQIAKRR